MRKKGRSRKGNSVKTLNATKLNVHMISRLLGHASVLVTEKVYARYLLPTLAEEVKKNSHFRNLRRILCKIHEVLKKKVIFAY